LSPLAESRWAQRSAGARRWHIRERWPAVEADAAGLGYAIAIEGLLGPEFQRGDVVRKAIETCHLFSQEENNSSSSGGGATGSGDRWLAAVAIS